MHSMNKLEYQLESVLLNLYISIFRKPSYAINVAIRISLVKRAHFLMLLLFRFSMD